ncbi:MAG TPA: ATP-binding protein [Anaerolineales bacterium]|nr:ATP-binding protein [Anaerolineales bacterium]
MPKLIFLFQNPAYIELPNGLIGWLGWIAFLGLDIYMLWRWWDYRPPWSPQRWAILGICLISVPVTGLLLPGIRLPVSSVLSPPLVPIEPVGPTVMLFSALPWFLAAGLLGSGSAGALAAISGFLLMAWSSHDSFLPLEMAFLGILLGAMLQQRYRTALFRSLRHPLAASILLIPVFAALYLFSSLLVAQGVLASRLDFAVSQFSVNVLAVGADFFIAGLFSWVATLAMPGLSGSKFPLIPAPTERKLASRFIYRLVPIALLLAVILMGADWIYAGKAAREMIRGRMANAAQMAAESVPFITEAGQNLSLQLARNPGLYQQPVEDPFSLLSQEIRVIPYFNQLFFIDSAGELIAGYPEAALGDLEFSPEEQRGIDLAVEQGIPVQSYVIPPEAGAPSAMISFVTAVFDKGREIHGVLVGRTDLVSNPLAQPVITSLRSMSEMGGEGILLDESGRILYHADPGRIMKLYTGRLDQGTSFYEDTAADGTRLLVYYRPVLGRPWGVLLAVPARYAQQQALNIAAPILVTIVILALLAILLLRWGLRSVTFSLNGLALEAGRIAGGNLDRPMSIEGEDEVGQLGCAFEQMRKSLKARLEELALLLNVSQGVASSLEIESSLQPVLESALVTGAAAARVVLAPAAIPEIDGQEPAPKGFGIGPMSDLYRNLDEQILSMIRQQDRLLLTNLTRPRLLVFSPGFPRPQSILAMALRSEREFYGTLWLAYDHPHQFAEDELSFVATLSSQAAMAAANASLFQTAEIGRQRLEAILASSPDPVLVTDHRDRLLLANPAAWQALEFSPETSIGQPVGEVITQRNLVELLRASGEEDLSSEIVLPDERVYLATVSTVVAEGCPVGRVCVLSDVTQFKKLDALKSEFVSTVSHDLRSPLTLIRGYATMLQMVGELNEQQTGHVRKIIAGVESMSHLVSNLLDLSRIEAGVGLQLDTLPVQDIVERVVTASQMQVAQKRIQLDVEISKNINPLIEADQALLQQALHNLVENAIKYTEVGGKVSIQVRVQGDQMVFEIHDTGIGIAPADQQRLFEKFYRAITQRGVNAERGSGLGLAIVRSIAERHGGRVWLRSQLGKGSTFFLAIPAKQPKNDVDSAG